MVSKYDEPWSDEELAISVEIYADVISRGGTKRNMPKDLYISRAEKRLPGRNRTSVQFRMCNISTVLSQHEKNHVIGWEPMKNVGSGVVPRIESLLKHHGLL